MAMSPSSRPNLATNVISDLPRANCKVSLDQRVFSSSDTVAQLSFDGYLKAQSRPGVHVEVMILSRTRVPPIVRRWQGLCMAGGGDGGLL